MDCVLCAIWMIPFGAALMALLLWLVSRKDSTTDPPADEDSRHDASGGSLRILYMDPRSFAALGPCAKLERLRSMTPECIGELLERSPVDDPFARPSREKYSTWPIQANLWCAGDLDGLRDYQSKLIASVGPDDSAPTEPAPPPSRSGPRRRGPHWLLLCALTLALLALLLSAVAGLSWRCCERSGSVPNPPVVGGEIEKRYVGAYRLQMDTLFEFNSYRETTDEHFVRSKAYLSRYLDSFEGIRIESVNAHADPIGETRANQALAVQRAAFLRDMIRQVADESRRPGQFASTVLPAPAESPGPAPADREIWRACYDKFYLHSLFQDGLTPLEDLSASKREGRPACSQGTAIGAAGYAACARIAVPKPGARVPAGYATRAERFREMAGCLAPMRYAYVVFSFTGLHREERRAQ